jgi:hypothetical protein
MKTSEMLLIGGGGLVALYLLSGSSTTTVPGTTTPSLTTSLTNLLAPAASINPASPVVSGAPISNGIYNKPYYLSYQYPALQQQNPNVLNPSYILTDTDAANYIANYLDLQQALPTWGASAPIGADRLENGSIYDQARRHWTMYGVADQRSFVPFTPKANIPFVPATTTTAAKSSGGGILGDVLSVVKVAAPIVAAIAGTPPSNITNSDVDTIAQGSAIVMGIMPLFYNRDPTLSMGIEDTIKNTLTQYL